jgi:hypothetical protein
VAKHRRFYVDRFLDKFQGRESIYRKYLSEWKDQLDVSLENLDVPAFKKLLVSGQTDDLDNIFEGLYRAYDMCTDRGHEDLTEACRTFEYEPDPDGKLPVECLSLKVMSERPEVFDLAYDLNTLWQAERFTIYRGPKAVVISDVAGAAANFRAALGETFKGDKDSDRVLVRYYQEDQRTNLIVYHERRTKAELVFRGSRGRPRVAPTIFRPAQQDFISYDQTRGQVEIEARSDKEETALRRTFAATCFGAADFFDGADSAKRLKLGRIAEKNFDMSVDEGDTAKLVELHFKLKQKHGPRFVVASKDVLETLDLNGIRDALPGDLIQKAVFNITFSGEKRGKRVELSGSNRVKFKRATHAEEVFRYLSNWGVLLA